MVISSGSASSGRAAAMKLGRRPWRASPSSVNWETSRIAPPTSSTERFILPSSSTNTRNPASLSAHRRASASVSPTSAPTSTM